MISGQSYGSRRLVTALANSGLQVGCYKRRLMRQAPEASLEAQIRTHD